MRYPPEALLEALETDGVLTLSQSGRYFGVNAETASQMGVPSVTHHVGNTTKCVRRPARTFLVRDRRSRNLPAQALRHAAGLAEMRLRLRAHPNTWTSHVHRPDQGRMPDGEFTYAGEACAVEFDAGSYERARVLAKMDHYSTFDRQIWGAGTFSRVRFLAAVAAPLPARVHVIHAPWFS